MRTLFVNPSKSRKRGRRKNPRPRRAKRRNAALMVNPRRRRARRRNAGITPFVSNPRLMVNPRRRSRPRRSNPLASPKKMLEETLLNFGGAAIGVTANYFAINKIDNVWARNGVRVAAALGSAAMLPGRIGSATAGAMLYPSMMEALDYFLKDKGWGETSADLDQLTADLEDLLNVA